MMERDKCLRSPEQIKNTSSTSRDEDQGSSKLNTSAKLRNHSVWASVSGLALGQSSCSQTQALTLSYKQRSTPPSDIEHLSREKHHYQQASAPGENQEN